MPFTPFHFGPGIAIKAAIPRFSFLLFCYAQIVTDLESAYYLFRGEYPVHRFLHTYAGAALIGAVCALSGRPLQKYVSRRFGCGAPVSWAGAFATTFAGTYSHIFLDSIMHPDITPLSPLTSANPLFHVVGAELLQVLCLALGAVGVYWFLRPRKP